jgi:hypothetical protein
MRRWLFYALMTSIALVGCTQDFPKPSRVDKLRVLAMSVDTPEVTPGETVEVSALVVNVDGADITYEWRACPLKEQGRGTFGGGSGTGASGGGAYELTSPGTCHDLELIAPELVQDLGSGPSATVTVPDDILSDANVKEYYGLGKGMLPDMVLTGIKMIAGINYTIGLRVRAGDQVIDAFKRVNVSVSPDPNKNPADLAFAKRDLDTDFEGPEVGSPFNPGECLLEKTTLNVPGHVLRPLNIPEEPPTYQVIGGTTDPSLPFSLYDTEETLFYSYFSTHGNFEDRVTKSKGQSEVRWTFTEQPLEPVDLWIVVRDGRGGTAWCHSLIEP